METASKSELPGQFEFASDRDQADHGFARLRAMLACPTCSSDNIALCQADDALNCKQCATRFPVFQCDAASIPMLFAEPGNATLEWKARYNGFLHANSLELERLRRTRGVRRVSGAGRRRINTLLHAREQHRKQVADILAPLQLEDMNWPVDATDLLRSKLPKNQGLSSYTTNIFRDWVWENGENEAQLDAIDDVLPTEHRLNGSGSILTLGAGTCRLPYDIHRRYEPGISVVLDLNPLLLNIAANVIQGNSVPLYEFPIAPLNEASFAIKQNCRAPGPLRDAAFHFVLGDAANPPFATGSFDTVLTPWLIDIIPHNLRSFVPRVNRLLKRGGLWVNSGSLAFFHKDESWCYSEEEVVALIESSGFKILAAERRSLPYLQSPHSAHGRVEKIFSFSAVKTKNVKAPVRLAYLPTWLLDTSTPIPASAESAISSTDHLLTAQVLAAIDGKCTINRIGRQLARQYGLGKAESIHAVRRILVDAWEDSAVGDSRCDL